MVNTVTTGNSATQALLDSVNGSTRQTASVSSEAQDRFLKLLTTQLKNQDPLNPLDNAQMTSQLAQISTVDGIEKLNATLNKLLSSSVDAEALQAAALVGRQVMVDGSGLTLTDAGAVGGIEMGAAADQVSVTIKDANGIVMNTVNLGRLDAGLHNYVWDGKTDAGVQAVNGAYSVSVAATRGADKVAATALELTGVQNINYSSQGVTLNLGSSRLVTMNNIKQIF
ncbi:MAG: flagellar hook assembly protein FlgD [Burkholderiaceae bacterium]|nr:flagellar hook assembly protein FlgD [Sulfuritalea sp.]MCF8174137.1 flagellar hook assembly protein FlgD [Burkholderiaceae bacterium]MCF8185083.1 flagellar hook assembly protein FlgD [Polynucleobacter sp.]